MTKVLVAEDEPALLESFCELVKGLGHRCVSAIDGTEAIEVARREHPDLVVTDLMMPGKTGLDLIRALRADPALSRVPVILLSAGRPAEADKQEAWRFLSKPVNIEGFERAVEEGLKASRGAGQAQGFSAAPGDNVSPINLAREAMLSWVAHEIKSPLSAALTVSQLAMRGVDNREDPAALKKRLNVIATQLMRMDALVNSILEAAQLHEGKLELDVEDFDVGEWVAKLAGAWQDLHPEYRFPVSEGRHLQVSGDRERLRQVIDNLISNAIKYGGPSKTVRIELRSTPERVFIAVADEGKGIPPEELPHIFNRFHRVAGQGGRGHGLGLYIAAALARLHGGELTVESTVDRGSTFTLAIPRKLAPSQQLPGPATGSSSSFG